jgi:hypothetical protein
MEVVMDEIRWIKIVEVFERVHGDLVVSYFKAHGIETQLIQDAYYEYEIGSAAMGPVQILVPSYQLEDAQKLYAESGWNFDTTENDDEDEEEQE